MQLKKIKFRLFAPQLNEDEVVAITGNQPLLGNWAPEKAIYLTGRMFPQWEALLNLSTIAFPLEYKFIVVKKTTKDLCYWEEGENRIIEQVPDFKKNTVTVSGVPLRSPKAPRWKIAGTVIPVFSLRSKNSFGIGDIGDVKLLIDWAEQTGQRIIQLLPINDTTHSHTWRDSYPYSAISIYAIHPIYVSINMLGQLNNVKKRKKYEEIQEFLNNKESLDYEEVARQKQQYLYDYYWENRESIKKDAHFRDFCRKNEDWLLPYVVFTDNIEAYKSSDLSKWGNQAVYQRKSIEFLYKSGALDNDKVTFTYFVQYTLHQQLAEISKYAREKKILLKGDLPIGVNRTSVEAWSEKKLFNMEQQAGAPPDDFSQIGQNWSFPTYNWKKMEADGFQWWKKRLENLGKFFDCMRIDHILGFFRIWEIPLDYVEGLCGHFRPALPLTVEEIEQWGLRFNRLWTVPKIRKDNLEYFFGKDAAEITEKYLKSIDSKHFVLDKHCSTQQKIIHLPDTPEHVIQGLMQIANEVLFLEDPYEKGKYHPRISAKNAHVYNELSREEQAAFDRLYNDFFYVRHNEFWKETALKRLVPLLDSTDMLICGEDLGMIPASVHEVMEKLNILSLELGRLSKKMNSEFTDLQQVPYYSVCTTSTHDMNPIRAWWKEDAQKTQRYYNEALGYSGEAPAECSVEIAEQIVGNHLNAASMLTIIPLQDWFAIDDSIKQPDESKERINVPANPNHYWRYRMHITLEQLLQIRFFNRKIAAIIKNSGR
ncbi:MAG: 4-alpha-glucanotransferase [Tannerella sp.]|jgi:4-alpha-glucanotransferase|nr:4-alpha-glucanotransferase [Tannerella sp.]